MAGSQKVTGSSPVTSTTLLPSQRTSARGSRALLLVVFIAGTGSMATEISASRLLAPYFGSSTVVWANVIGLILASLALGYVFGGRLADRRPEPRVLGAVVLLGALAIAAVPFLARPFLDSAVRALDTVSTGAMLGSFCAALVLFAPGVTLLGMVTPFAIRLAVTDIGGAGRVAGRIFALSTVGSLLGTFVPALVTIPLVGTQRTLLGAAGLIALGAVPLLGRRWLLVAIVPCVLLALPPGFVKARAGLVYERESQYQFIQVVEDAGVRYLFLNEGYAVHSEWRRETTLTGGEWDMFLTAPPLLGRAAGRVAILGSAGGTTARAYGVFYPSAVIDAVEIDPAVSAAGTTYFGLHDNPRVTVHTADARPFLRSTAERYDLILIDAYRQPYVPFYLTTREFFTLCRQRLSPGGIIALNVSTVPGDDRLAQGVAGTLASVFPQVETWQALRFNQFVLGFDQPAAPSVLQARLRAGPRPLRSLTSLCADNLVSAAAAAHPWTDDRAPVEWVTDRMIMDYAVSGADTVEERLPTDPAP